MKIKKETKGTQSRIRVNFDRMLNDDTMRFSVQFATSWGPMLSYGYRYFVKDDVVQVPMIFYGKASMRFIKWPRDVMAAITNKARAAYWRHKHDSGGNPTGSRTVVVDQLDNRNGVQ
jgi:hypothetical protein